MVFNGSPNPSNPRTPVYQGDGAGGSLTGTYPNPTIAPGSITQSMIAVGAVGTDELANGSISAIKLQLGIISGNLIVANSILQGHLGNDIISGNILKIGSVLQGHVSDGYVDLLNHQVVSGIKMFNRAPRTQYYPRVSTDLTNKYYVDTSILSGGGGSGTISGSGTAGRLLKFITSDTAGNSVLSESAGIINVAAGSRIDGSAIISGNDIAANSVLMGHIGTDIKNTFSGISSDTINTQLRVTVLENNTSGISNVLTNTQGRVTVLESNQSGINALTQVNQTQINVLNNNFSGVNNTVNNTQLRTTTLEFNFSGTTNVLTNTQSRVTVLDYNFSGLQTQVNSLDLGNVSGVGTTGQLIKFLDNNGTIGNSLLSENAGKIATSGNFVFNPGTIIEGSCVVSGSVICAESILFGHLNPSVKLTFSGINNLAIDNQSRITVLDFNFSGTTNVLTNTQSRVTVLESNQSGINNIVNDTQLRTTVLTSNFSGLANTVNNTQLRTTTLEFNTSGINNVLTNTQSRVTVLEGSAATISGSGTAGRLTKFSDTTVIADSLIQETADKIIISGTQTIISGNLLVGPPSFATKGENGTFVGTLVVANPSGTNIVKIYEASSNGNIVFGNPTNVIRANNSTAALAISHIVNTSAAGANASSDGFWINGNDSFNCSYRSGRAGATADVGLGRNGIGVYKITDGSLTADGWGKLIVSGIENVGDFNMPNANARIIGVGIISGSTIAANSILQGHLANNIIGTSQLQIPSVSGNVIATPGIGTAHLVDNTVTNPKILASSISGNVIQSQGILNGHLGNNILSTDKFQVGSVSGNVIATPGIWTAHLADNTVTNPKILASSVSGNVIQSLSVLNGHIGNNEISTAKLQIPTVSGSVIATPGIGTGHLANNIITNDKILASSISGNTIQSQGILNGHLANNILSTDKFQTGVVSGSLIATPGIGTNHILDASITAAKLAFTAGTVSGSATGSAGQLAKWSASDTIVPANVLEYKGQLLVNCSGTSILLDGPSRNIPLQIYNAHAPQLLLVQNSGTPTSTNENGFYQAVSPGGSLNFYPLITAAVGGSPPSGNYGFGYTRNETAPEKLSVDGRIDLVEYTNTPSASAGHLKMWASDEDEKLYLTTVNSGTRWVSTNDITVYKYNNESTNTDTTVSNDSELFFAMAADEIWQFEIVAFHTSSSATPDIKVSLSGPGTPRNLIAQAVQYINNGSAVNGIINAYGTEVSLVQAAAPDTTVIIKGTVENGTTAGNLSFQWAQNSSNAADTTIRRGSYIKAIKIRG